ncbi:hypothetical protein HYPSUDRAFT_196369 [Hypholoma sublateritium FD-334 SS-4]|uniref:Uncharacterized protein n=1 Tax=Hypholoma sublateritium (strain FD-334 SS-4) TaxID=945553 RepID=A0A0D2N131_HYPSF|nr:hypothetical protein HYPSUDRAFT_196369 [Hypholoma sublateritium FD-334 SS-4]
MYTPTDADASVFYAIATATAPDHCIEIAQTQSDTNHVRPRADLHTQRMQAGQEQEAGTAQSSASVDLCPGRVRLSPAQPATRELIFNQAVAHPNSGARHTTHSGASVIGDARCTYAVHRRPPRAPIATRDAVQTTAAAPPGLPGRGAHAPTNRLGGWDTARYLARARRASPPRGRVWERRQPPGAL